MSGLWTRPFFSWRGLTRLGFVGEQLVPSAQFRCWELGDREQSTPMPLLALMRKKNRDSSPLIRRSEDRPGSDRLQRTQQEKQKANVDDYRSTTEFKVIGFFFSQTGSSPGVVIHLPHHPLSLSPPYTSPCHLGPVDQLSQPHRQYTHRADAGAPCPITAVARTAFANLHYRHRSGFHVQFTWSTLVWEYGRGWRRSRVSLPARRSWLTTTVKVLPNRIWAQHPVLTSHRLHLRSTCLSSSDRPSVAC